MRSGFRRSQAVIDVNSASMRFIRLSSTFSSISAGTCEKPGSITVSAKVCNRGTNPAPDGVVVAFTSVPKTAPLDGGNGTPLCSGTTQTTLQVGMCTVVSCDATVQDDMNIYVTVDPDNTIADCHPGTNRGAGSAAGGRGHERRSLGRGVTGGAGDGA